VPDWLPPAAVVHRGDWKLIRIFHGGEDGAHRWMLFNLRDDLGETNDLAAQEPDRVKAMDALIERFLADTGAVVPVPNPDFDPAAYRPDQEGIARPRAPSSGGTTQTQANASDDQPELQGWKPRSCAAAVSDGVVTVKRTGPAPFLGLAAGRLSGPTVVTFRARSAAAGTGKVEWRPSPQSADEAQSVPFELTSGTWQEVRVELPADGPLGIVRLYLPATSEPLQLDWIELRSGRVVRRSDF